MYKKLIASAFLAAAVAAPAHAQNIISQETSAQQILKVAKSFGSAELTTSKSGSPLIKGKMNGHSYNIYFFNCSSASQCAEIQFVASWNMSKNPVSLSSINTWNRTKRFGRAYIGTDDDPWVEMDVNLNKGITEANLRDNFEFWDSIMKGFDKHLD